MALAEAPQMTAGDQLGVPILKIHYPTDREKIAALLPPGIEPSDTSNVTLSKSRSRTVDSTMSLQPPRSRFPAGL